AEQERHRRGGLKRRSERRPQHLVMLRLIDPQRLAVGDDRLLLRLEEFPAHPSRTLEEHLAARLEGLAERRRLDRLREVGGEVLGRVVAPLELAHHVFDLRLRRTRPRLRDEEAEDERQKRSRWPT